MFLKQIFTASPNKQKQQTFEAETTLHVNKDYFLNSKDVILAQLQEDQEEYVHQLKLHSDLHAQHLLVLTKRMLYNVAIPERRFEFNEETCKLVEYEPKIEVIFKMPLNLINSIDTPTTEDCTFSFCSFSFVSANDEIINSKKVHNYTYEAVDAQELFLFHIVLSRVFAEFWHFVLESIIVLLLVIMFV